MFPSRAVRHVFELLQMRTQSNPPSCTKESQSWISICITLLVFKQSFAFWQTVHRMLAWSLEADNSALCQNMRGFTELKQTTKLCTVRKYTQHKLNPFSAGKTLTIHLKVNDNFGVTRIWTEMATAWAACFSQETVVLEEARYHSSGTSQDGCSNRWNILITPDWHLWKLHFNYILQWQKTRPLLYLWITFYSNLLITDAISLCEQKLTLVFFFSFTVSFQNKNTFTGKS